VEYISHLDALSTDTNASLLSSWSRFAESNNHQTSLIEQLQTTLDIQQLLDIYLSAIGTSFKFCAVELDTYHGKFKSGKAVEKAKSITLPLHINDSLMGRVTYYSAKPVSDIMLSSLSNYQKVLAYPLRNALAFLQLQQMALKDPLTGIGNRAMYDEVVNRKIQKAQRTNEHFTLMVMDLDNFKQVNDKHGHLMGDEILTSFVSVVQECLRGSDEMFRFGGDEFAIVLDQEGLEAAKLVAARIHHVISQHLMFVKYGVSTSIGCACFKEADSATDLFARADKALYAAKDAGKACMKIA
jgi:diguanylate cyclase (GGDEF)-like protein